MPSFRAELGQEMSVLPANRRAVVSKNSPTFEPFFENFFHEKFAEFSLSSNLRKALTRDINRT